MEPMTDNAMLISMERGMKKFYEDERARLMEDLEQIGNMVLQHGQSCIVDHRLLEKGYNTSQAINAIDRNIALCESNIVIFS